MFAGIGDEKGKCLQRGNSFKTKKSRKIRTANKMLMEDKSHWNVIVILIWGYKSNNITEFEMMVFTTTALKYEAGWKYKNRNLTDNCCSNTSIPSISPNNSLVSAGKIRP